MTTNNKKVNKSDILNVRIPASAVVGESKKAVLIGTNAITFWLPKTLISVNKLADFMQCYSVGLPKDWDINYVNLATESQSTTTGSKLAANLEKFFKIYNSKIVFENTIEIVDDTPISGGIVDETLAEEILADIENI